MLTIKITSYEESNDTFAVKITDSSNGSTFDSTLPATLLPYVAPGLVAMTDDLPFDLVGGEFSMLSPLID